MTDSPTGEISEEVVATIAKLMAEVIGESTVKRLLAISQQGTAVSGSQLIYAFAQEAQNLLGDKGGYATMRQVGRSLAKTLMAQRPEAEWENTLQTALSDFGFASQVETEAERAFICHCVFYDKLQADGLQPTQHAVCWAGWGFIEGFMKTMHGVKGIEWVGRDVPQQRCEFSLLTHLTHSKK